MDYVLVVNDFSTCRAIVVSVIRVSNHFYLGSCKVHTEQNSVVSVFRNWDFSVLVSINERRYQRKDFSDFCNVSAVLYLCRVFLISSVCHGRCVFVLFVHTVDSDLHFKHLLDIL